MATPTTPGFSPQQPTPTMPLRGEPGAQGQPAGQGLQQAASPVMQLLANWMRVAAEVGQHYSMIADKMNKIAGHCREALMILAREATQGQQGQGLPTEQSAQLNATTQPGQRTMSQYPPAGY